METTASPHHLIGISRIHGDPRRMPDVDYSDKTSASILANPRMEQTKRYRAWENGVDDGGFWSRIAEAIGLGPRCMQIQVQEADVQKIGDVVGRHQ